MEIHTNEKRQVFTFNVSCKLQQTKRDYMDTEVNLSLRKTSLIWNSYRFPVSYKSKKGAENVKIQAKVSIWKETTKPCRKQTPSYTEAQVTLTQEETEHSADQNLIRVQAKFKTVLVYYRAWCSVEVPESTLLLATIITWGRKARLAVWKVSEVCVMTRAWKYY